MLYQVTMLQQEDLTLEQPKKGGRRCVVGGCSNSWISGYCTYSINTVSDDSIRRRWFKFINNTRSNFDKANAKTVYICDGHFTEDCFNKTQTFMFNTGLRKKAPSLLSNAVPSLKIPTPPHFKKLDTEPTEPRTAVQDDICTLQENLSLTLLDQGPGPCIKGIKPICPVFEPEQKKRRCSKYLTHKDIAAIEEEIQLQRESHSETNCPVEDCKESHHSVYIQIQPDFQHQQTQSDSRLCQLNVKSTRHKGTQVRHKLYEKGTQTEDLNLPSATTVCCRLEWQDKGTQYVPEDLQQPNEPDLQTSEASPHCSQEDDPDWIPPTDDSDSDSDSDLDSDCDEEYINEQVSHVEEGKYIIFESKLMELFDYCKECKAPCTISKSTAKCHGSMLVITQECTLCPFTKKWTSQPLIGTVPAGNLLLASSILYAGNSPTKALRMFEHMNIRGICHNTYLNHQKMYLQPVVVTTWKEAQAYLLQQLRDKGDPLVLGGDGRCDSPGHNAKFGTYTMMDLTSSKVIDIQIVQSTEVANSNAMELEGLKRSMSFLHGQGLKVSALITDRHPSITKWMRENHPEIRHQFDVWHIAKGLKKQLSGLSKMAGCEEVALWQKSIINHLYWSATSTPDGNGALMAAKFHSLTNHVKDKHTGHGEHADFDECSHGELEPRCWLKEGTKVYDKLCEIITKPHLSRALKQMSPLEQTSNVEAFHGVMCMWAPKLLAYSYTGMKCRSYLAVMHWNENGMRDQAQTSEGTLQYCLSYPKQKAGECTVKKVLASCTYDYVKVLFDKTLELTEHGEKNKRHSMPELAPMEPLCAKYERPSKAEAVAAHIRHGRFSSRTADNRH